jgi:PAT family beta-lactamase induction signal transducer AmpG
MATAALFTCMMDHAAPDSAATDYTVQASLVLAAGGFVALPSGFIAERVGYGVHFALALSLGLASAVVVRLCVPAATGAGAQ